MATGVAGTKAAQECSTPNLSLRQGDVAADSDVECCTPRAALVVGTPVPTIHTVQKIVLVSCALRACLKAVDIRWTIRLDSPLSRTGSSTG